MKKKQFLVTSIILYIFFFTPILAQYSNDKVSVLIKFKTNTPDKVIDSEVRRINSELGIKKNRIRRTNLRPTFTNERLNRLLERSDIKSCKTNIQNLSKYYTIRKIEKDIIDKINFKNYSSVEYVGYIFIDLTTSSCSSEAIKCNSDYYSVLEIQKLHELTKGKNASLALFEHFDKPFSKCNTCLKNLNFLIPNTYHAMKTLGVIYSDERNDNCNEKCPKGLAPESSLKYISIVKKYDINSLLKPIFNFFIDSTASKRGDIMLFEYDYNSTIIEVYKVDGVDGKTPFFDLFKIANCLGITVIEPSGNCSDIVYNSSEIADSGAILVGAAYRNSDKYYTIPGTGTGTRIDTYNLGNIRSVICCKDDVCSTCSSDNCYCQTSAAAALTAGLALEIQSLCYNNTGTYLMPSEMREIFRNAQSIKVEGAKFIPQASKIIENIPSKCFKPN